jgi:hypothetical protein
VPYTELDSLYHGPAWTPRPSFAEDVASIACSAEWVSEWQYSNARPTLLARAQLIVCLDYARAVVVGRVIRRTLRRRLRREQLWNGNREPALRTFFTNPDHIVRWSWSTFDRNRRSMREVESHPPPGLRVIRLRSPRETREWFDALPSSLAWGTDDSNPVAAPNGP